MDQIQSTMFKISRSDVAKGVVTAVFAAVVMALAGIVSAPNFDIATMDWHGTLHVMLNTGIAAFVAYIAKNFFSNQAGQFAGKVG